MRRSADLRPTHLALCLALCGTSLPAAAAVLNAATPDSLRNDVAQARGALTACSQSSSACSVSHLPADEQVKDGSRPAGGYAVHWTDARDAMESAAKESDAGKRQKFIDPAVVGLDSLAADLAGDRAQPGAAPISTERARRVAADVLANPEFQRATGPTWLEKQEARIFNWLDQLFGGLGRMSAHAPWLPAVLEWLFFAAAAAGLIVLAQRTLARQRLRVALGEGAVKAAAWDIAPAEWARDAERFSSEGNWREAIHCLYWASIVLLEDRRAWRHNPARTPREYVRLLKPGSEAQGRLGALTGLFERVWYGLRDAAETDYRDARQSFDGLERDASPIASPVAGDAR